MNLKYLLSATLLALTSSMKAYDCELFIQVLPVEGVPSDVSDLICTRLQNALNANGAIASGDYGQFYISAKCGDLYKETLATAPMQVAVNSELTLGIAEIEGGSVFATKTFNLKGVGTTEQRAYINALKGINGANQNLVSFIKEAKDNTIMYFDKNYKSFLTKAKRAASMHDYSQALYYSTLIPSCSKGYSEAEVVVGEYYQNYVDEEGEKILNNAKAAFAVSPNANGAVKAYALLALINPQSKAYNNALKLANDIKKQTKVEYDFEVHQKYKDNMVIRQSIINAAREIGIAYGKSHQPDTTLINFI